ncbi:hypothetical protein Scep_008519 [Stephania cephalantha]|uniref:Uncharacterized protein n=1 Tax=Stephania cephalantha TaxID=152367 RepID=A0AAP0KEG7_9MAGN
MEGVLEEVKMNREIVRREKGIWIFGKGEWGRWRRRAAGPKIKSFIHGFFFRRKGFT